MAKLSLFNKARKAAKKAREAAAKAERKVSTRVGTATKPGVKRTKGLGVQSKTTGKTVAQAPLRSRGRKVIAGTAAAGAAAGTTVAVRNKIKKAEAAAKKARAEAAAAAKRADAAEKRAAAAAGKGSFRKRRAARLEKRIAKPGGSEERKKIQRTRLKRVKGRMADGGPVKMQRGGSIPAHERMASGEPIQWQSGPVGERRRMDYRNYVTPGVAKRQLARQAAAGGPGRRAANISGGGWKEGGLIARMNRGGSAQNIVDWFNEQTSHWTPKQRAANKARVAATKRRFKAQRQLKKAPPPTRVSVRGAGGAKEGGAVKKKSGGAVKMQGGGLSRAQQSMLRQAQEYAASSGQNPAALRKLTAQHGDLWGASQQKKARSQMAGNQPGRTSVRSIGPGMKKGGTVPVSKPKPRQGGLMGERGLKSGGAVKKKSGGAAKKMQGGGRAGMSDRSIPAHERMASGEPIQWQSGPVGERRRMDYRNYVTPGVAKRQLSRQAAAGGPGRKAANIGGGGWKKGGAVKRKSKPRGVGIAKRGFGRASR